MGATDSMTELYTAIRTRLLTYTDGGAAPNTIAAAVGTRLYNESPPDAAAVPYLLLTIDGNSPQRDKDGARIEFQVEVQVIHSPRTNIAAARRIADLAWKAMAGYTVGNTTDGFVQLRVPPFPETLPPGSGDADREVVQIRIVSEGFAYWKALSTVLT
jgi:hypothetical protein